MATRTLRNYIAYAVHLRIPTLHGNARSGQLWLALLSVCALPHALAMRAKAQYAADTCVVMKDLCVHACITRA
jgi:hypothetical protein